MQLQQLLETHLQESEAQVERVNECFALLDIQARAKPCKRMMGIVEEREEVMAELISEMHEFGLPALAVSHDPHLAALADRVAVMSGRRIVQHGTPDEVLSRPCSVAVARLLGHRNLFTARVAGHETDTDVTMLQWEAANGATLRLPQQPELATGQLVQWMIALTAVRLPSLKDELRRIDNPVTGRVESRLNLGAHFQVALRCGTERLWLAAQSNLVRHHGLETGSEVTVDLRSNGLVCWPHLGGVEC